LNHLTPSLIDFLLFKESTRNNPLSSCYGSAIKLHLFKERFDSSKMLIFRRFNRVPLFSKKNQPNWLACTSPKRERKGNF
ncbi:MAG: hypothetical protein AB7O48_19735, partial [Cyclobacteriaceae bacterium]